jgi:transglutaminase-like putative cysteine protease
MSEIVTAGPEDWPAPARAVRVISCDLVFAVVDPSEVVLQLMASRASGHVLDERFDVQLDSRRVEPVYELSGPHGARVHVFEADVGRLSVSYRAEIDATAPAPPPPSDGAVDGSDPSAGYTRLVYLRPSRYCPSDHLVGFAVAEFGLDTSVRSRVESITGWIRERIGYVAGSSSVHDSAEDTLLTGMGTCRDFAHLGVALSRALGIPARFVSVYAPGLFPMDFHAVFETLEEGAWIAHDATDLAPRQSLVRIGTGRDAADTAFASINRGIATLEYLEVSATVGGDLPVDDPHCRFHLA